MNANPSTRGNVAWHVIRASLGVILWLAVALLTFISIPRGARLFAEFHMAIPLASELLLRFGQWAIPVLALVTFLVCWKVRRQWAWLWFLIVLPIFLGVAVFVSIYVPLTRLLGGLFGTASDWWSYF